LIGTAGIPNPKVREKVEGSSRSRSVFAYSFHSLRATFNTQLESVGVSDEVRMKLSDHTSPAVNQLYTKPERERLSAEMAKLPKV
jgi:integrase